MFFASDNGGPVHPAVMAALTRANEGHAMPYGACDWTARAVSLVREALDAPQAEVWFVPTGTCANAITLAAMRRPWARVYCTDLAHIHVDEWGAPAFYSGGGELGLVQQTHGRMTAADLEAQITQDEDRRRGAVSITQATETGTVYDLDSLRDLTQVARIHGVPVQMDGARFANATAALGCTPKAMTDGISALSLGATKNGCMGAEAIVLLDPECTDDLPARRYRGGHTFSKHRYLAAQIVGYLEEGLWLDIAAQANAKAQRLAGALAAMSHVEILHPVEVNMIFARMPRKVHQRLQEAGAQYYIMDDAPNPMCRLVCDWSVEDAAIDHFVRLTAQGA